ncbi:MAG TPA: hypothetical protein VFG68_09310 [Fimbriiglobus sp.]|nr:hypothetical protein [Fimbriiglobus sp.]
MQPPILILPTTGNGYVAGDVRGVTAEGVTPELAVSNLRMEAERQQVARLDAMTIVPPAGEHPILRWAGMWKDHPLIEEWKKAVEEYRTQIDNDPSR